MQVVILGGAGFLGRKVAAKLAEDGHIGGTPITGMTLFDLESPPAPKAKFSVTAQSGDIADLPEEAVPDGTRVIFHLAAVVSAAAEADYDLGRRVNLRGTDSVIDAARRLATPPRVVFTSSVASFSGGQGVVLGDDARQLPANSYGAQKAAAELILADATRRGFLDAVSIRLPTIVVRPGRPNKAASSFLSAIIREPLLGLPTGLPVARDFAAWIASPRRAVDWLVHAAALDGTRLGADRSINPPGLCARVDEMLAALEAVHPGAADLVRPVDDPGIAAIVGGWPAAFSPARALALGFSPHESLQALVEAFVEDDLAATKAERGY